VRNKISEELKKVNMKRDIFQADDIKMPIEFKVIISKKNILSKNKLVLSFY
jgi:hypothetical protein